MEHKIVVKICTGTTCHLMGGHLLFDLEERLPDFLKQHVKVEGAHCLGLCGKAGAGSAPFATVDGEVLVAATMEKLADEIRRRFLAEGRP